MSDVSAYLANKLLDHAFRNVAYTPPAAVYCALFNGDPQGAGSEVTTTIRVAGRVAITFGAAAAFAIANSVDTDFGNAAGGTTVTHFAIYDAASSGNLMLSKSVGTQTIGGGAAVKFVTGALTATYT